MFTCKEKPIYFIVVSFLHVYYNYILHVYLHVYLLQYYSNTEEKLCLNHS